VSSRHQHYEPPRALSDPSLFEQEPPSAAVDTSETAAQKVHPRTAYWRARIVDYIKSCGMRGATEREVEQHFGFSGNYVRPRLWEAEGNAPAGRPLRAPLIRKGAAKRDGARIYVAI